MRTFRITYTPEGCGIRDEFLWQTHIRAANEVDADAEFRRTFEGRNMVRIERQIGYLAANTWETLYQHPDLDPPRYYDDDDDDGGRRSDADGRL